MSPLFDSGRIVDLILGLIVVEAAIVWGLGRRRKAVVIGSFAPTLLSGVGLLLALRGALVGAWWGWIAAALLLALLAHLTDLAWRLAAARARV